MGAEDRERIVFPPPWTSPYTIDPADPHHFINAEGEYLFLVNKTAWAYFGCKNPQGVLDRAKAQGVNVLRVALEGTPYEDVLGIELWPWGGTREVPDWTTWNETYWDEVEKRIRLAGEQGIGFDLVLYFRYHPVESEIPQQQAYWNQVLHRLAKYPNIFTWEITNEYTRNEAFQDAVGMYFNQHDPWRRPVCSSDGTTDDALWPAKPWMNLAINHTCTGSLDLQDWYLGIARNTRSYGKPAFNNESGREKRHRNDDGVHRRKQGWLWCAAGGYWTWHSWDGCEGIDETDYKAPGEEFLRPMASYFRSIPFWRLSPKYTAVRIEGETLVAATLADAGRHWVITYCCTKETGARRETALAHIRLPDGDYTVSFFQPRDGALLSQTTVRSSGSHQIHSLTIPPFTDDCLIQIKLQTAAERTQMPGTQ
ncbi:MAG: DUF4038 domain-containing protein [bacterium]|jgi:hypothetical protein|nr:DUF4038 domain-containing protein [bacterium]